MHKIDLLMKVKHPFCRIWCRSYHHFAFKIKHYTAELIERRCNHLCSIQTSSKNNCKQHRRKDAIVYNNWISLDNIFVDKKSKRSDKHDGWYSFNIVDSIFLLQNLYKK